MSTGRINLDSSGFRFCISASLVLGVIVLGKSVVSAFLMAICLSPIAGATMSFALSPNCHRGCTVPVIGWSLLTGFDAWMKRVNCAGTGCFLSFLMVIGFQLHFYTSSLSAVVFVFFGSRLILIGHILRSAYVRMLVQKLRMMLES